ncbi:MAG: nucleotidyltransferase domain-containing protein [Bacteroidales bacterium]|nr:nucleotidyltransferase domain-containing protein [Bacteroidales bacterium]MCD8393477.1 nucleotidyltransferase domain-containing protein [Bacteroidales bacterium]
MTRPEAVEKIRKVIRSVAPTADIILFGSEARGQARRDSDFDVLILEDGDAITRTRRLQIVNPLYDLSFSDGIEVSPIVQTKAQWNNRPLVTPFYLNVQREGIRL